MAPRRSSPTPPATCARAPAPTSSTSSTASCARPSLASGCLAGVTRALVIEWCGAREVDEPLADVLASASEAFLRLDDARRPGDRPLGRPRPARTRTGHEGSARRRGPPARLRRWTHEPPPTPALDPAIARPAPAHRRGAGPRRRAAAGLRRGADAGVGRRRGARPHDRHRPGDVLVAARAASTGSRATPRATSSGSRRSASTATATPCSSWSTRSARPATPATTPASTPTSCTASMADPTARRATHLRAGRPARPRRRRARRGGRRPSRGSRGSPATSTPMRRRLGDGVGPLPGRRARVAARGRPGAGRAGVLGRPAGDPRPRSVGPSPCSRSVAAVGLLAATVEAFWSLPDKLADALARGRRAPTRSTHRPHRLVRRCAASAAVLCVVATLAAVVLVAAWPEMGTKYDAPTGARADERRPTTPPTENIDIWKALDEGRDPTA